MEAVGIVGIDRLYVGLQVYVIDVVVVLQKLRIR